MSIHEYENRVLVLVDEGMTRSDAQGVVDAEEMSSAPPPRYETLRTDYKWDKCYGVYDHEDRRFVLRDTVKRHCIEHATKLNNPTPVVV